MSELPTINDKPKSQRPDTKKHKPNTLSVVPASDGYQSQTAAMRRIDVTIPIELRRRMIEKLRQLQDIGAKLKDGTHVTDKSKMCLWIFENLIDI